MSNMPIQSGKKILRCECRRLARGSTCDECQRRECFDWNWEKDGTGSTVVFQNNDRDVIFNPGFSVGTVAVRGSQPFKPGYHHYWEIEMSTEVYGTDMMIGVGTDKTDLRKYTHNFVSLLGMDEQSWGLSYSGQKKHAGQSHQYAKPFGQHSVIGIHLDLWAGTLEFYVDRKPLGMAFEGLRDKILYPIISSTAARSGMNLIFCRSYPPSLQLQAMLTLSEQLSTEENVSLFEALTLPPGLKVWMKNNYWWIVSSRDRERRREEELNNRAKYKKLSTSTPEESGAREQGDEDTGGDSETEDDAASEPVNFNLETSENLEDSTFGQGEQKCTQQSESGAGSETNCMRILAASSRAHFLGRISPIFIGLPEGGFSVLSSSSNSTSSPSVTTSSRSRSLSAQPSTSATPGTSTSVMKIVKQPIPPPSSSDEEDGGDDVKSTRREPKRLKLRESIEAEEKEVPNESPIP